MHRTHGNSMEAEILLAWARPRRASRRKVDTVLDRMRNVYGTHRSCMETRVKDRVGRGEGKEGEERSVGEESRRKRKGRGKSSWRAAGSMRRPQQLSIHLAASENIVVKTDGRVAQNV